MRSSVDILTTLLSSLSYYEGKPINDYLLGLIKMEGIELIKSARIEGRLAEMNRCAGCMYDDVERKAWKDYPCETCQRGVGGDKYQKRVTYQQTNI